MSQLANRFLPRLALAMFTLAPMSVLAYNLSGERWASSPIVMRLQLGASTGTLIDGSSSWGVAAEDALAIWNSNVTNMKLFVDRDSPEPLGYGNGFNNVFWGSTIYGDAWDSRTLAVTLSRTNSNGAKLESDVIFNNTLSWNSYRGALRTATGGGSLNDFHRVALHEFGHVLGLGHPDDIGQRVTAVMNADVSSTDSLTSDDTAGAKAIYDSGAPVPLAITLYMQSPVSYRVTGSTLNLQVSRVQNDRPTGNTTGTLQLELWAMPQHFNSGLPTGSRRLGVYAFSSALSAGFSFPNVNVNTSYTAPPGGTYYVALLLTEFTGGSGSGFTIRDYQEFDSQIVIGGAAAPAITAQPFSQSVAAGARVTLTVSASGAAPLTYQWFRNGAAIAGATSATLTINSAQPVNAGTYTVVVTNGSGNVTSTAVTLTVNYSRLINVSTRGLVPAGGELTPGFVMRGTGTKQLVIRGVGPTLSSFGIGSPLSDPKLDIILQGASTGTASNDNWGGSAILANAFASVGAFALPPNSRDAAVLTNLSANQTTGYTVRVTPSGTATSGVAIAEVYDSDGDSSPVRLINVSTRGFVGTGENTMTAGFVIRGNSAKQLLIRAVGPGLSQFGVDGLLGDPQLQVRPLGGSADLVGNDNWGGTAALKAVFTAAGAFTIADNSRDAAVVVTLQPGGYTVVVSGVGSTTGNALVEIYDLDP